MYSCWCILMFYKHTVTLLHWPFSIVLLPPWIIRCLDRPFLTLRVFKHMNSHVLFLLLTLYFHH